MQLRTPLPQTGYSQTIKRRWKTRSERTWKTWIAKRLAEYGSGRIGYLDTRSNSSTISSERLRSWKLAAGSWCDEDAFFSALVACNGPAQIICDEWAYYVPLWQYFKPLCLLNSRKINGSREYQIGLHFQEHGNVCISKKINPRKISVIGIGAKWVI